jgi:hypothetical protein
VVSAVGEELGVEPGRVHADCGGDWGYAELKETIADPSAEEHEEMLEWLGLEDPSDFDPAAFDLASVNARLHGPV